MGLSTERFTALGWRLPTGPKMKNSMRTGNRTGGNFERNSPTRWLLRPSLRQKQDGHIPSRCHQRPFSSRKRPLCGIHRSHTFPVSALALCLVGAFLLPGVARAQRDGYWTVTGGDPAHNNWQKSETKITQETVAGDFKFLWKIKLGNDNTKPQSFTEPLLFPFLITGRGFKDMALWGDSETLYSVDSELGTLIWQKKFDVTSSNAHGACSGSNIQIVMEAPPVIHFGAAPHPAAGQHPPIAPPTPPPTPATARRLGAAAGGGVFGLKGIYVLTRDGYIHEQILATGLDYAPSEKFLPAPDGDSSGLNMNGDVVYTTTGQGCKSLANGAWSIDLSTPNYTVNSYKTQKLAISGHMAPAIGADGTAYIETGSGRADASAGVYANSVVALSARDLKVKDWYTPTDNSSGKDKVLNASPVVFSYKGKELIAAAGKGGSIVLLDSGSLGGPDHHTPLAQTDSLFAAKSGAWESLASWQDKTGAVWLFASIPGPVETDVKFAETNGAAPHGSILAFRVEDQDGKTVLTPSWISRDLINPAPPAIANGVVFALAGGSPSTHAVLYALDAATGKQLYSSGDAIQTYSRLSGMSVGSGHVFFTTHDHTLYSFGIPMEH